MATTFDRLVAAGAPRIHEPYSYRIEEPSPGSLKIILRRDLARGGTGRVASKSIDVSTLEPAAVLPAVVAACRAVVAQHEAELAAYGLVGEYSPRAS
jgi:hypothetical protein